MLDTLLEEWGMNYMGFAEFLEINRRTLYQYRQGQREFSLTWKQVQKIEKLLESVGKKFADLPEDWIRDKK